jgi:hypothetical protein
MNLPPIVLGQTIIKAGRATIIDNGDGTYRYCLDGVALPAVARMSSALTELTIKQLAEASRQTNDGQ